MFLHSDTLLSPGWPEAVRAHMATGKAGYFRLRFDSDSLPARIVAGWANLRARLFGLPYGDQGLLVPAALYHKCGGYPDIPLMEDIALSKRLRRIQSAACIRQPVITSSRRWLQRGVTRTVLLMWKLRLYYFLGVSPQRLAAMYR